MHSAAKNQQQYGNRVHADSYGTVEVLKHDSSDTASHSLQKSQQRIVIVPFFDDHPSQNEWQDLQRYPS